MTRKEMRKHIGELEWNMRQRTNEIVGLTNRIKRLEKVEMYRDQIGTVVIGIEAKTARMAYRTAIRGKLTAISGEAFVIEDDEGITWYAKRIADDVCATEEQS